MTSPPVSNPTLRSLLRSAATALTFCALIILAALAMQAQTFNVIHQFSLGPAGNTPVTGVTIDARGRLYGTTSSGGVSGYYCDMGCGVVYASRQRGRGGSTLRSTRSADPQATETDQTPGPRSLPMAFCTVRRARGERISARALVAEQPTA